MKTREEYFRDDLRKAINKAIANLDKGTVGISADCLWQLTVGHIVTVNGPYGTNAGWVARQEFNHMVSQKPYNHFVYQD